MKISLFERILEIIPGFLMWLLILLPFWGGITFPIIIINVLVILSVYWLYRAIVMIVFVIVGFFRYKHDIQVDWLEQCNKLDFSKLPDPESLPSDGKLPYHLIVIANYGEDYNIIKRTIDAIANQNYPIDRIFVTVSIEERKAKKDYDYAKRGEFLQRDFGEIFKDRLLFTVHPDNIPGEAIGAASNRTWGTSQSVKMLEARGYNLKDFLITAPDGDLVLHKNFLAAVTYKWLTSKKRNNNFYQTAVYTFNNNYWDVPILIRILMINLTLPVLASSVFEKHKRETWSCFTLNLQLMKEVNYWDTTISVGADDTTFYWRPFFYLKGDWHCEVFFVPLSADAVYHPNYFINHIDQYKQYQRWGWGVISFPIAVKGLIQSKDIPLSVKLNKFYHLFEVFIFWKVFAFLVMIGLPIVFFVNADLNRTVLAYTAPNTVSNILFFASLALIPATFIKLHLIPPKPKQMSWLKFCIIVVVEAPLNIITLFTYSFIPFVDATTRLMLGQARKKTVVWSEKRLKQ
ncbi:MAG: hypothetical protein NZZ41_07365 [Candidatus Dojkabacteria bacterium]|nr:hypothetical protein [Candidatus Dojkabacteria bacterium]